MQRGKEEERLSMLRAEMSAPERAVEDEEYCASGVEKFCERCVRIGVMRSSSSRRGRAREVIYVVLVVLLESGFRWHL